MKLWLEFYGEGPESGGGEIEAQAVPRPGDLLPVAPYDGKRHPGWAIVEGVTWEYPESEGLCPTVHCRLVSDKDAERYKSALRREADALIRRRLDNP